MVRRNTCKYRVTAGAKKIACSPRFNYALSKARAASKRTAAAVTIVASRSVLATCRKGVCKNGRGKAVVSRRASL